MSGEPANGAVREGHEAQEEPEVTARFSRDDLVRGWREREARQPRVIATTRLGVKTDLGRVRENNEDKADFYEPEDPTLLATRGCFYAVADGMGGHAAGQIASEMALKQVIAAYYDSASPTIQTALSEAVVAANEAIHRLATLVPSRSGMGTTLTALIVVEDSVYVAQVGDSRAYLIRGGSIRQVTEDHSWVAEQVRLGGMTAEEAEVSPYRNVITRSIGTQSTVELDLFAEEARSGDRWVLCSDGLTGHVADDEILRIASEQAPSEACRQLVEVACARGGRDNVTVLVLAIREMAAPRVDDAAPSGQPAEETRAEAEPAGGPRRGRRGLFGR